jgi:hypothetical protein
MRVRFNLPYFLLTAFIFAVEVLMALYAHDRIVRPYIGDLLVVVLIYCFVRTFLNSPILPTAISVLIFSYVVEWLQYFHIVNLLGLQDSKLARIIIGTSFEWIDLLSYTVGICLVLLGEKLFAVRRQKHRKP